MAWLKAQTPQFRESVKYLAIDPAATYASAIRTPALLPNAKLVVDDFQLTKLADDALTKVRRRVTWELMTVAAARSTRSGPTGAVC